MGWFLTTFFAIYAGMHAVLYLRLRPLLPVSAWRLPLALAFIALMVLAPVIARIAERDGYHLLARVFALGGFWWMGLCSLGFMTSILSWLLQGGLWVLRRATPLDAPILPGAAFALLALGAALALTLFGAWEAGDIQVQRLRLTTDKLPAGVPRLVIAQVSDVHLGILTSSWRMEKITRLLAAENPDLLVSTGDMVDGTLVEQDDLVGRWAVLHPRLGKYAIIGNHEVYQGLPEAMAYLARCGFTVLRNQALVVGGQINLAGVDDPAAMNPADEPALLDGLDHGLYTVLLKHRPAVDPGALGRFDLQLSGHAHGGQIYPFNYVTGAIYPLQVGLHGLTQGSAIYASRGTGTWGPPMRIGAPPEVTIIELTRGAN